jgi:catechol 2,3-dioxygenase-like lactoylglutathione lyase family enzyme
VPKPIGYEKYSRLFDHVSVTVSDMERSLAFYRDELGLREVERHLLKGQEIDKMTGKRSVVMEVVRLSAQEEDRVLIDLQRYVSPKGKTSTAQLGDVAHTHFALRVKNLDSAYQRLRSSIDFLSEPVVFKLDFGTVKVVFLKDPDGAIIELSELCGTGEKHPKKEM